MRSKKRKKKLTCTSSIHFLGEKRKALCHAEKTDVYMCTAVHAIVTKQIEEGLTVYSGSRTKGRTLLPAPAQRSAHRSVHRSAHRFGHCFCYSTDRRTLTYKAETARAVCPVCPVCPGEACHESEASCHFRGKIRRQKKNDYDSIISSAAGLGEAT